MHTHDHHDHDHDHDHEGPASQAAYDAVARAIWEQDSLALCTVGIDIGSSTSHLLFADVLLRRETQDLSSRFVVVEREVRWRSPITLTPFLPDGTIDADALREFFRSCYRDAGLDRSDVDSGAVILTGEAIKKKNARAIDDIFATESGTFVCATAGHNLEATLAAHGSGATELSRRRDACGLHVDIGGGTTKLALIDRGEIVDTAAIAVGGRLLARDEHGTWSRIDESAHVVARELGIGTAPEEMVQEDALRRIIARLATLVVDQIVGAPGGPLALTAPLSRAVAPHYVTMSGGVAEYVFGHETEDHGDIAKDLAAEITAQLAARTTLPLIDAGQRIRATAIGASQFTVQVSGKTVHTTRPDALPVHNVPVAHLGAPLPDVIDPDAVAAAFARSAARQDLDVASQLALAFTWSGPPEYERLLATGRAIMAVADPHGERDRLLVLVIDGDVGQTLGRLLVEELGLAGDLVSIDGVQLRELDFIDVGAVMDPPGVIPVVIKSLLFA